MKMIEQKVTRIVSVRKLEKLHWRIKKKNPWYTILEGDPYVVRVRKSWTSRMEINFIYLI